MVNVCSSYLSKNTSILLGPSDNQEQVNQPELKVDLKHKIEKPFTGSTIL